MTDLSQNSPDAHTQATAAVQAAARLDFGARLQAMREARGVTLPSLAQSTRINPHFLVALEAGAFERLPGEVFGRGFVRCIAKTFSEDQDTWGAEYDRLCVKAGVAKTTGVLEVEYKSKPVPQRGEAFKSNVANITSLMRRGLGMRLVAAFLALIGLGIGVTKLLDGRIRRGSLYSDVRDAATGAARAFRPQDVTGPSPVKAALPEVVVAPAPAPEVVTPMTEDAPTPAVAAAAEPAAAVPAPVATVAAAPEAPVAALPAPVVAEVPVPAAPVAAVPAPTTSEPVAAAPAPVVAAPAPVAAAVPARVAAPAAGQDQVLELLVTEAVRVRMDVDSGEPVVKELTPDTYRFTFTDKADMLIYDAGAVKISFNGRPLGSLGNKGRVRRISFQAASPEAKKL